MSVNATCALVDTRLLSAMCETWLLAYNEYKSQLITTAINNVKVPFWSKKTKEEIYKINMRDIWSKEYFFMERHDFPYRVRKNRVLEIRSLIGVSSQIYVSAEDMLMLKQKP